MLNPRLKRHPTSLLPLPVLLIAFILSLIWCIAFYVQIQRAFQWWHHKQSAYLQNQAEQIREGALQDLFVIRRGLELLDTHNSVSCASSQQEWLAQVDRMHLALERLSHSLSPAYIDESLPLAIQYALKEWQLQNPGSQLQTHIPSDWRQESPERVRVVLDVIQTLLDTTVSPASNLLPVEVQLENRQGVGCLTLQISYPDASCLGTCHSLELAHLKRSFELLTSGWCTQQRQGLTVRWSFCWQLD